MQTYIGIDWGEKKMGTAFADGEMRIAFGGGIIENDDMIYDNLHTLCLQHDDCAFIVGITEHATQNDNADAIKKFADVLKEKTKKKVDLVEEMFTTSQAQKNMKAAGKKNVARNDDVEAARILLQSYLDNEVKSEKCKM